jgi:hypothetical protein
MQRRIREQWRDGSTTAVNHSAVGHGIGAVMEAGELAIHFGRDRRHFVSQTEVESQIRAQTPVVLQSHP